MDSFSHLDAFAHGPGPTNQRGQEASSSSSSALLPPSDFQTLFEAAPAAYLVLTPELRIVAASDAYLHATMTTREGVLGRPLFEVFPDNPDDPAASGVRNLRASLERVLAEGVTDVMAIQKYDIRRPSSEGGEFEERFWSPINSPVFGPDHHITYLIHRVEDVTQYMQLQAREQAYARETQALRGQAKQMEAEIYLRGQQLQEANRQLRVANAALEDLDRAKTAFFSNVSHEFRTPLTLLLGPLDAVLGEDAEPLSAQQRAWLETAQRNGLRLLKLVNTLLDFSRLEAGRMQASYEPTDLAICTTDLASVFRSAVERAGLQLIVDCPPLPELVFVDRQMWERIVLNLLSNALKFTFAGQIIVRLRMENQQVMLEIQDTGIGIPPEELGHLFERFHQVRDARARTYEGTGIGLALVQELVHLHGGTIQVSSQVGVGSTFAVTIPLGQAHLPADQIRHAQTAPSPASLATPYLEEALRWPPEPGPTGPTDTTARAGLLEQGGLEQQARAVRAVPSDGATSAAPVSARILVVEDNADMRAYLRRLLSERYQVETVEDGAAALENIHMRLPDLVLSDVMMPGLDGFALLAAIRAHPTTTALPVILLSARAGEEATVEGLATGATDYLVKPFSPRELLARVAVHLALAQSRREASARASELETVFETMTDGLLILNAEGHIDQMNQAGRHLMGLHEADETRAFFALPPEERATQLGWQSEEGAALPPEQAPMRRVLRGEVLVGTSALTLQVRTLDGRKRVWGITGAPMRNAGGQIYGGVLIFQDITERQRLDRRTREALQALVAMAEAMVEGAGGQGQAEESPPAPIQATAHRLADLTHRVVDCQRVTISLLDPEAETLQPLVASDFSPEQEAQWSASLRGAPLVERLGDPALVARLHAGEALVLDLATLPPTIARTYYGVATTLVAPMVIGTRLMGVLSVHHEQPQHQYTAGDVELVQAVARLAALVIERERLLGEREAARAAALAEREANEQMDTFLSLVSHELKQPLTVMGMHIQLAQRQIGRLAAAPAALPPSKLAAKLVPLQNQLTGMARQTERQDGLISDLLDAARIRTGKLTIHLAPTNLLPLLRGAVEEQRQLVPRRVIRLDLPAAEDIPVLADGRRLEQVVTNYLTNALKYSPAACPVEIGVTVEEAQEGAQARVWVRDQGPGLAPDQRQRIFERFYRAPGIQAQSGDGIGLGLGLYICRTIIEQHGGQVGVVSTPEQGSVFWFTLPVGYRAGATSERGKAIFDGS